MEKTFLNVHVAPMEGCK